MKVNLLTLGIILSINLIPWCNSKSKDPFIKVSGQVEADTVKILPLIGGRIIEINFEKGKRVKEGEVLAKIDCTEIELQLKQAKAALKGANAKLQLIEKGARKEDIRWMRQIIKQAKINKEKADRDIQTLGPLATQGAIPQKQYDDLISAQALAEAKLAEAQEQYTKMIKGAQPEEIESALSAVEQAEATIDIIEKKLNDCIVLSPASGTVTHKLAQLGEIAAPGIPLGIIAKLDRVKVVGFISEKELGHIKLGDPVHIYVDSFPGKPLKGIVTWIADEAEFTPKNIQTEEERIKTVYEIEATVDNQKGILKDGMPVDMVFRR